MRKDEIIDFITTASIFALIALFFFVAIGFFLSFGLTICAFLCYIGLFVVLILMFVVGMTAKGVEF